MCIQAHKHKKRGHTTTFSVRLILKNLGWAPAKKQFRVRYCHGKTLLHSREREKKKEEYLKGLSSEDPELIAIRTLLLATLFDNSGHNIVKNRQEWQRGNCTKLFTKSAGRTKKARIRFAEQRLLQQLSPRQESTMKKECLL